MTPETQADIVRSTLAVLFIGVLIASSFWILSPFLTALLWAAMIVITTWPLMLGIQRRLLGKRWLAVTVMTVALLLLLILPLTFSIISVIDRSDEIANWVKSLPSRSLPPAPSWLQGIPMVGPKLAARWQDLAAQGQAEIAQRLEPHAREIMRWLVAQAGNVGMMIVQFLLTVIISAVLYSSGEKAAHGIMLFSNKLSGRYGEDAAIIAAKTIRGVALGVVVTAVIQAVLGGIGLFAAGIPAPVILTVVMFILCVAQIGPAPVLIPAIIWLYYKDEAVWGTVLIVWSILVATIDNFIRPVLIRKGADLPLLLIFAGVIGGLIAFGVIGLFIGPVMLAVAYNLLKVWVLRVEPEPELSQPSETAPTKPLPQQEPGE